MIGLATVAMIWARHPMVFLMWCVSVYYCWESHFYYSQGYKPYGRLSGHLKRAVNHR